METRAEYHFNWVHTFSAMLRDQSAGLNQAIYFFWHVNNPFQLKYICSFHGHERKLCLIEGIFG